MPDLQWRRSTTAGTQHGHKPVIIMLTDSADRDKDQSIELVYNMMECEAQLPEEQRLTLHVIGIGPHVDLPFVEELAEMGNGSHLVCQTGGDMDRLELVKAFGHLAAQPALKVSLLQTLRGGASAATAGAQGASSGCASSQSSVSACACRFTLGGMWCAGKRWRTLSCVDLSAAEIALTSLCTWRQSVKASLRSQTHDHGMLCRGSLGATARDDCAICTDSISSMAAAAGAVTTLPCAHCFHKACWARYTSAPSASGAAYACPICRRDAPP